MARKKKGELPSGNIRTRVYLGKDPSGKRLYKSFTAPDRDNLKLAVALWKAARAAGTDEAEEKPKEDVLTVSEAVRRYIQLKESVLSPATVRAYYINYRQHIKADSIGMRSVDDLAAKDVQLWISTMAETLSPKTVRNVHTLLTSSVKMFRPDWNVRVTLPQKRPPDLYCPSDADVKRLLSVIKDPELEAAVLLGAFCLLRRSEICALESSDIKGTTVTVKKALVLDEVGAWVMKAPKTPGSFRTVDAPDFVVKKIRKMRRIGRIVRCTPNDLSDRFREALKESGCPTFRFHDLRHYGASIMHAIGVPDQYIMERGGWSSDHVMKRVYRNVIRDEKTRQTEVINAHFAALIPS